MNTQWPVGVEETGNVVLLVAVTRSETGLRLCAFLFSTRDVVFLLEGAPSYSLEPLGHARACRRPGASLDRTRLESWTGGSRVSRSISVSSEGCRAADTTRRVEFVTILERVRCHLMVTRGRVSPSEPQGTKPRAGRLSGTTQRQHFDLEYLDGRHLPAGACSATTDPTWWWPISGPIFGTHQHASNDSTVAFCVPASSDCH